MAPRHERRSAAGCRCAHWLRDLPGVDAWWKLAVLVDAYRSPVAQRRARWPRERRRIAARWPRDCAARLRYAGRPDAAPHALLVDACSALVAHDARHSRDAMRVPPRFFRGGGRRPAAAPAMS
ncbi:hypothetical protein F511_47485 [Dorcoceras hygrometricum]|uniref:Uncharacterized protein n=1 Tax=Dorcoceras hygrometricum TaxID=472368 RepID=A0A2Z6ZQY5_9LAMI|nr:hypothetical protein F511_47485 [Dorcoceras hygrometricum]